MPRTGFSNIRYPLEGLKQQGSDGLNWCAIEVHRKIHTEAVKNSCNIKHEVRNMEKVEQAKSQDGHKKIFKRKKIIKT